MSTTFELRVGDRGRVVLPAALRQELGLKQGSVLTVTLTDDGQLVTSTPRQPWPESALALREAELSKN